MNVVKIMGGLGNQLFQYALAKHLEHYDEIGFDVSYYDTEENQKGLVFLHRDLLLPCFVDDLRIVNDVSNLERVNQWEYDYLRRYKNCWFWGDWQRASYFHDTKLDINLKDEYITDDMRRIAAEMKQCNSVSVHVRRTDYAVFNWILDPSYYTRAFKRINTLVTNPHFYIFSDDIEWCKDHLPIGLKIYMTGNEIEDFWLMSQCKHNIIANSTFSFWAAYLNKNKEKQIIYPERWNIDIQHPVDYLEGWKPE